MSLVYMQIRSQELPFICSRCLRAKSSSSRLVSNAIIGGRPTSQYSKAFSNGGNQSKDGVPRSGDTPATKYSSKTPGAMSRRLEQMTNDSLAEVGNSSKNTVGEAGFSEELKSKLEERIAAASFRSENAQAFAAADLSVSTTL